jgi:1-pyrroline-5-carboxylate dehydrogenase
MAAETIEIPLIVGGKEIRTGKIEEHRCPHDHSKVLARFHMATPEVIGQAVEASQKAWADWSELPVQNRLGVFLRMAELLAGPWRDTSTPPYRQSKTCYQADRLGVRAIDFTRNPWYALSRIYLTSRGARRQWNSPSIAARGLAFAVTSTSRRSRATCPAPAMMGNVVLWKPASSSVPRTTT